MTMQSPSKPWNPYLAGALAGLLLVLSVYVSGKYFGASTTYVRAAGFVESTVDAERVSTMAYFIKETPKIDWQFLFVIGIGLGSLGAALLSNTFRIQAVPDRFAQRFGQAKAISLSFSIVSVGRSGDVAWVAGKAPVRVTLADGTTQSFTGRFTSVLLREKDGWRMVQSHFSAPADSQAQAK